MDNIEGIFEVTIAGKKYQMKNTLGVTIKLENELLKKPITLVLNELMSGASTISNVLDIVYEGIRNNGTRVDKMTIGKQMFEQGMGDFTSICLDFLSYSLIGKNANNLDVEENTSGKK